MPRAALWLILAKAGLPDWLITIIRSFDDGIEAVVAAYNLYMLTMDSGKDVLWHNCSLISSCGLCSPVG